MIYDLVRAGGRELAGGLADIRLEIKVTYTWGYTNDTILRHGCWTGVHISLASRTGERP